VLLAGTLEQASMLTAELVSITAEELTEDLGAICAVAAPPHSEDRTTVRALTERLGQLERAVGRRERGASRLQKLWTQFATPGGRA
jgi:beta-lactamase class A